MVSLFLGIGVLGGAFAGAARADSVPADPANPATPATVTADALPTVQIDGVAWSQVVVGDTVFVGGRFSNARPAGAAAGTQQTPRSNLLAYDIRTGALITSFAPVLNGQVLAVAASPDGSRIYVGGDFTRADGQPRSRLAAYDTATGALVPDFAPVVSGQVNTIAATDSTVYLGGYLYGVGSVSRHRLAAVAARDGALLPWAPVPGVGSTDGNNLPNNNPQNQQTSDAVKAMVLTGNGTQVVVGGHFDTLNGSDSTGVGALDATTGETRPFAVNRLITNQGVNAGVLSLSTDGANVYGTAYDYYGPGNLEGSFAAAADGGAVRWFNDCHGDTYSNFPMNGALYMATHAHVCSNIGGFPEYRPQINKFATAVSLAATGTVGTGTLDQERTLTGQPAPSLLNWFPTMTPGTFTGQGQAGWSVSGNSQYVVYGGEFPSVNGAGQQGLVRYALTKTAPNRVGPSPAPVLTGTTLEPGVARISWTASSDQDSTDLTYRVFRDGEATPVHTVTRASTFWDTPVLSFVDGTAVAGTHTYRVSVSDPTGNTLTSDAVSVATTGTAPARAWSSAVLADGARGHWPLGERTGAVAYDWAGASDLTLGSGVTLGRSGALAGDADTAARFSGTSSGLAASQTRILGPQTFSVEAWFSTTSTRGGKIVGFGSSASGTSGSYDRHVYMDTGGRVHFGVYPGTQRTVNGSARYNDGRWHHVVATLGADGMRLYVDGALVGSRADTTSAQSYSGYWRVGGDTSWSGAAWFNGQIDEVAVYGKALPADVVASHHSLGTTGKATNVAPAPAFVASADFLTASFDAAASTDSDGTVTGHAWDFGDGTTGAGVTATHTYAAGGSYPVTLTVTDEDGASASLTRTVTVTAPPPNVAPTAAFTSAVSALAVTVDGAGSVDPDGSLVAYDWDFGDGSSGTGATATHEYAEGGTYPVVLTVTDDDGATATATGSVTVAAPPQPSAALAADSFGREVARGLGTADLGGAWTIQGNAADAVVTGGTAQLTTPRGVSLGATLPGVAVRDVAEQVTVTLTQAPTGGGTYVILGARRTGTSEYRGRLWFNADGTVSIGISTVASGAETVVGRANLPGTYTVGTPISLRVQAAGTGTTQLGVKAWVATEPEPADWQVTAVDTSAELQQDGVLTLQAYQSGAATTGQVLRVDDVWVGAANTVPLESPPNAAPTASSAASVSGLDVSFDGSSSADRDGTVVAWAWDFGDGTTGTGETATHTYAAAGSYPVTLTVTDDDGATATATSTVTVVAPSQPGTALAADSFGREVARGLGIADSGGAWRVDGNVSDSSVTGGAAQLTTPKGWSLSASLPEVAVQDVAAQATVTLDQAPTGGGTYVNLAVRRTGTSDYRARLWYNADGTVALGLSKVVAGSETLLTRVALPGTHPVGTPLTVRVQAAGAGSTQLAAKAWPTTGAEPAAWQVTATDGSTELQRDGSLMLVTYQSGTATSGQVVRVDDVWVGAAGTVPGAVTPPTEPDVEPPTEPENVAPTAAFTSTVTGLTVTVDGSASADTDGTVDGHAWDFGDGTTGTGATATHEYTASGSYPVTLTVTDDDGATATTTSTVTVEAPPAVGDALASDAFGRELAAGLGTADLGGAWRIDGSTAATSVTGGAARLSTPAGSALAATLTGVSAGDVTAQTTVTLSQAASGGGTFVNLAVRRTGTSDYRTRLWFRADGTVALSVGKVVNGSETLLRTVVLPGSWSAGTPLTVRMQAAGSGTTQLGASVWAATDAEPATWQVTATDSSAELQGAGALMVQSYQSGTATAVQVLGLDDVWVGPAGTVPATR
jgi:PKD repeat protein